VGGDKVTLDGAVSGAGEFWTYGAGTVRVVPNAGSGTFASSVVIASGTLEIADFTSSTLGTGGFFIAQGGSGTLRYTGPSTSTNRIAAYALQGTGVNSSIEVTNAATKLTLGLPLDDSGQQKGLTKIGLGTLALAVAPTYTGDTVVAEGELSLNEAGFADTSTITVTDDGQLELNFTGSDIVAGIVLGVDNMAPGTYNATTHPTFISGTGSLVIPSPDPFPAWIATFSFEPGADLSKSGDPDGDGQNNLLEFALDGDPSVGAASGKVHQQIDGSHFILTLPVRLGATFSGAGPLSATVIADGISYDIEGSTDLVTFSAGVVELGTPITAGLPALNTGWEYRSFRISEPITSQPKSFLRAKITTLP
jgi:autotransporter-associated beta strand protein